jgi:hypothetical protein
MDFNRTVENSINAAESDCARRVEEHENSNQRGSKTLKEMFEEAESRRPTEPKKAIATLVKTTDEEKAKAREDSGAKEIPMLTVMEKDTGKVIGYLTPFRGYCFQISKTIDGEDDLASSEVVGFGSIVKKMKSEIVTTNRSIYASNVYAINGVLRAFLDSCLLAFTSRRFTEYKRNGNELEIDSAIYSICKYELVGVIEDFINDVIKYINNEIEING